MFNLTALLFGFGVQELLLIFGLCLLMFGATRLPQLGKGLGEGIRNFKQGLKPGDDGKQLDEGQREDEAPS